MEDVERSRDVECNVMRMGINIRGCVMGTNSGRRAEPRRHSGFDVSAPLNVLVIETRAWQVM